MLKDFEKVCELQDVLFESTLELDANLISHSDGEDEKKNAKALHKEVVTSYAKVQKNNRKEALHRGVSIGMLIGGAAAAIVEIVGFLVTIKRKNK